MRAPVNHTSRFPQFPVGCWSPHRRRACVRWARFTRRWARRASSCPVSPAFDRSADRLGRPHRAWRIYYGSSGPPNDQSCVRRRSAVFRATRRARRRHPHALAPTFPGIANARAETSTTTENEPTFETLTFTKVAGTKGSVAFAGRLTAVPPEAPIRIIGLTWPCCCTAT